MWADSINHRSEDPWSNVSLREYSHSLTAREDAVELPARRAQSYHTYVSARLQYQCDWKHKLSLQFWKHALSSVDKL